MPLQLRPGRPSSALRRALSGARGEISDSQPGRLTAHAYVRYLGELSAGQILRKVVAASYGLPDGVGTAFYAFGDATSSADLKRRMRAAIDGLPVDEAGARETIDEATSTFAFHILLFREPPLGLAANLLAGLRASRAKGRFGGRVVGRWIGLALGAALLAHLVDLRTRWR